MVEATAPRGACPTVEIVKTSLFDVMASSFAFDVGRLTVDTVLIDETKVRCVVNFDVAPAVHANMMVEIKISADTRRILGNVEKTTLLTFEDKNTAPPFDGNSGVNSTCRSGCKTISR